MRTFVGIDLPDDIRARLSAALSDPPSGLRWSPPNQWHVTLAFLGEVETSPAELAAAMAPPGTEFHVALGTPGRFGNRVLFLGLDDDPPGALTRLADAIRADLDAAGLPVDERPFRPHLTLARARRRNVTANHVAWLRTRIPDAGWKVSHIHVLHSHLGAGPARHETVATVAL